MYYLASDQADCRERCRQEGLGNMGGDPGIQEEAVSLKRRGEQAWFKCYLR